MKPTTPNYDISQASALSANLYFAGEEFDHEQSAHYRYFGKVEPLGEVVFSIKRFDKSIDYVCRDGKAVFSLHSEDGVLWFNIAADSQETCAAIEKKIRKKMPEVKVEPNDGIVPVTFWAYGPHGPYQVNRDLSAVTWGDTRTNYCEAATQDLDFLYSADFKPGTGGQLILWHGPAGTGKTTALRVLAEEWKPWAELHYVTDPEKFFGVHADYMLRVMLGAGESDLGVHGDEAPEGKWRVLVLEDCGDLLSANAREETGTALGRFLNAVDGLIGQGLRVLVLATTNEKIENWHEAVIRPGRAASIIHFDKLSEEEVEKWWEKNGNEDETAPEGKRSLADLYAKLAGSNLRDPSKKKDKKLVGFAS